MGFTWGGWVTGSKADVLARQQVQAALIEVLTPICVEKFSRATDAQARLVELKKISSSWDRERFVRENDWAKFGKESNSRVWMPVRLNFTNCSPNWSDAWLARLNLSFQRKCASSLKGTWNRRERPVANSWMQPARRMT